MIKLTSIFLQGKKYDKLVSYYIGLLQENLSQNNLRTAELIFQNIFEYKKHCSNNIQGLIDDLELFYQSEFVFQYQKYEEFILIAESYGHIYSFEIYKSDIEQIQNQKYNYVQLIDKFGEIKQYQQENEFLIRQKNNEQIKQNENNKSQVLENNNLKASQSVLKHLQFDEDQENDEKLQKENKIPKKRASLISKNIIIKDRVNDRKQNTQQIETLLNYNAKVINERVHFKDITTSNNKSPIKIKQNPKCLIDKYFDQTLQENLKMESNLEQLQENLEEISHQNKNLNKILNSCKETMIIKAKEQLVSNPDNTIYNENEFKEQFKVRILINQQNQERQTLQKQQLIEQQKHWQQLRLNSSQFKSRSFLAKKDQGTKMYPNANKNRVKVLQQIVMDKLLLNNQDMKEYLDSRRASIKKKNTEIQKLSFDDVKNQIKERMETLENQFLIQRANKNVNKKHNQVKNVIQEPSPLTISILQINSVQQNQQLFTQ